MKNRGFGHLKTRLFTTKTSKHVGFGGSWFMYFLLGGLIEKKRLDFSEFLVRWLWRIWIPRYVPHVCCTPVTLGNGNDVCVYCMIDGHSIIFEAVISVMNKVQSRLCFSRSFLSLVFPCKACCFNKQASLPSTCVACFVV